MLASILLQKDIRLTDQNAIRWKNRARAELEDVANLMQRDMICSDNRNATNDEIMGVDGDLLAATNNLGRIALGLYKIRLDSLTRLK